MLFDSHLHFADEFEDLNLKKIDSLIREAKEVGVERFISNSTNLKTNYENLKLMQEFDSVFVGFGIYPDNFKTKDDLKQIDEIIPLIENNNKIIIGEIGLDFKNVDESVKKIQFEGFKRQLKIAKENDLFVEIHSRYAIRQTLETLIEEKIEKAIMHWYLISKKYVKKAINEGYFLTIGPSYIYNHDQILDIVKEIPLEQVLFETDYPVSFSGVVQKPKVIKELAELYCRDFDLNLKELEKIQEKNFKKIFSL